MQVYKENSLKFKKKRLQSGVVELLGTGRRRLLRTVQRKFMYAYALQIVFL